MDERRPEPDDVWMGVAGLVAQRSRCGRKVGAVIISQDGRVVGTGYNGPPAGYPTPAYGGATSSSSCSGYCERLQGPRRSDYGDCPALHAELNALLYSDATVRRGGTIFITTAPCLGCAKAIANSGLSRVVWNFAPEKEHRSPAESRDFLEYCGLMTEILRLKDDG